MEDIFKPEPKSILKLFIDGDSLYQIPDYQRPYSWTDEEVDQLWEDLTSAFFANKDNSKTDENYFLGSIITVPAEKGYQDVIDGQQRITTLMILFCVIRDLFPKLNDSVDANSNPQVIKISKVNRCIMDDNDLRRLKFKTAPSHQNDFQETIINSDTKLAKKPTDKKSKLSPKSRFENTAFIFRQKLNELSNSNDNIIGEFINYIFNSVKVIKITCNNRSFAIKLFQSLNATGLDLTPTDLLKSFLMSKISDDMHRPFVDDWNKIESISRETDFKDLNEIFVSYQYHLLKSNPKGSLNDELEREWKTVDPNKAINDVKNYIITYRDKVLLSEFENIFALRYLRWSLYWKTIATSAYKIDYAKSNELINEVKRFYYLYWIAGKTLTQIKQTSFNILKWLNDPNMTFENIKTEIRNKIREDGVESLAIQNLSGFVYNEPWFKPLLLQIEYNQLEKGSRSFIPLSADLHVEHIIPKEFKKFKEWNHISDEHFDLFGNSIGNLTLLSGSKNIEASHNPFHIKLDVYRGIGKHKNKKVGNTPFEITRRIVDQFQNTNTKPIWEAIDSIKRWNWFCDETSRILELNLKEIKRDEKI